MESIARFVAGFGMIALIVSLVKPGWAAPWLKVPTRKAAAGTWFAIALVAVIIAPPPEKDRPPLPSTPEQSAMTPDEYERLCATEPEDIWRQRCENKLVIWDVFINKVEGTQAVEIRTRPESGSRAFDLQLAKAAQWDQPTPSYANRKIRIRARLDAPSGYAHDLDEGGILSWPELTADEQAAFAAAETAAAEKAALAEKEATARTLCQGQFRQQAKHPSSVSFSPVTGIEDAIQTPDGGITIRFFAKAKNAFNMELRYLVACHIDKAGKATLNAIER